MIIDFHLVIQEHIQSIKHDGNHNHYLRHNIQNE